MNCVGLELKMLPAFVPVIFQVLTASGPINLSPMPPPPLTLRTTLFEVTRTKSSKLEPMKFSNVPTSCTV